jgi:hypothetical protein
LFSNEQRIFFWRIRIPLHCSDVLCSHRSNNNISHNASGAQRNPTARRGRFLHHRSISSSPTPSSTTSPLSSGLFESHLSLRVPILLRSVDLPGILSEFLKIRYRIHPPSRNHWNQSSTLIGRKNLSPEHLVSAWDDVSLNSVLTDSAIQESFHICNCKGW